MARHVAYISATSLDPVGILIHDGTNTCHLLPVVASRQVLGATGSVLDLSQVELRRATPVVKEAQTGSRGPLIFRRHLWRARSPPCPPFLFPLPLSLPPPP